MVLSINIGGVETANIYAYVSPKVLLMRSRIFSIFTLLFTGFIILAGNPLSVKGGVQPQNAVVIYFFWGDGCPHCAKAEPFLKEFSQKNPGVELRSYEVWHNPENQELFNKMAEKFGFVPSGVPTIFAGNNYWVGFSDEIANQIETSLMVCLQSVCPDAGKGIVPGPGEIGQTPLISSSTEAPIPASPSGMLPNEITIPLIGTISLENQSSILLISLIIFGMACVAILIAFFVRRRII